MLTLDAKIEDQSKQLANFKSKMLDAQLEEQNQKEIVESKNR